jgi:glycosyltransferase involved in cell wall biosynthesis
MDHPLISIVIRNYNYARFLKACIDSAIAIRYSRKEILVVDDGSTDQSRDVIASYGDQIRAFFKPNRGQVNTSNFGFEKSQGGLVYFLDSDDLTHPDMLDKVVNAWQPHVCKVQYPLFIVDANGQLVGNTFPTFPAGLTAAAIRQDLLVTGSYPCPPTTGNVYARWYLRKLFPLDERCFRWSDGPLNTAAPLYGDVLTLHEPLAYYRVHESNDWSQSEIQPHKFALYIRHDLDRIEYLRNHAGPTGHRLAADPLGHSVQHLVFRLASKKFLPERHPISESIVSLAYKGTRTALFGPNLTVGQRLLMAIWFPLVATTPRALALMITKMRLVPTARPAILRFLLHALNASRAAKVQSP